MTHIETLVMNEVRKALENLQNQGVGYIDFEQSGIIHYSVDGICIRVEVADVTSLASAGIGESSTQFLYGTHADKLAGYEAIGTVEEIQQKLKNMSLVIDTDRDLLNRYIAIGTIEEFKALKENSNGYSKEDIELNRKAMYNKAIDDFASKLIMHFADWKLSNAPFNDDETDGIGEIICETIENAIGGVEEIAEQLKAGVENDKSI